MILVGCCVPGGTLGLEREERSEEERFVSKCRFILKTGFDYTETNAGTLCGFSKEAMAFLKEEDRRDPLKIRAVNGILPATFRLLDPGGQKDEIRAHCETLFCAMERMEIPYAVFGSGGARRIPDGMERAEAEERMETFLRFLSSAAGQHGVTVVIEPLCRGETNLLNTVPESWNAVRRVGSPWLKLLCDTYHMAKEGEAPDVMTPYGEDVLHCHIAESPARSYPGKDDGGDLSYNRRFGEALRKIGYQGGVSAECRFRDFIKESPVACAYMKEIFAG